MIKIHIKSIFYPHKAPVNKSDNLGMKIKPKREEREKKIGKGGKRKKGRKKGTKRQL